MHRWIVKDQRALLVRPGQNLGEHYSKHQVDLLCGAVRDERGIAPPASGLSESHLERFWVDASSVVATPRDRCHPPGDFGFELWSKHTVSLFLCSLKKPLGVVERRME